MNPLRENRRPRRPHASEVEDLVRYHQAAYGQAAEDVRDVVSQACIAVFDDYMTDSPGYQGRIMVVVYAGSPSMYDVFTWTPAGEIEFMPNDREYRLRDSTRCDERIRLQPPVRV